MDFFDIFGQFREFMVQDLLFRSKFYEIKCKFMGITYFEDQNNNNKFKAKLLLKKI